MAEGGGIERRTAEEFLVLEGFLHNLPDTHRYSDALLQVPVTACALALGLAVLANTWLAFSALLFPDSTFFNVLAVFIAVIACLLATALLVLYGAKIIIMGPLRFLDDLWTNPNVSSRLVFFTMTLMSIAFTLAYTHLYWLAAVLWVVGVVGHVAILCVFLTQAVRMGIDDIDDITAAWVMPTIGLAMASGSGIAIGFGGWVTTFFWLALLSALLFFPIAVYRIYVKEPAMHEGLVCTNVVLLAPPALLFIEYLSVGGHRWQFFPFTHVLYFSILCVAVLVAFSAPQIIRLEYNTTTACMTFPLAFAAKATIMFWFGYMSDDRYLSWLFLLPAVLLFLLANAIVGYVCVRFVTAIVHWHTNRAGEDEEEGGAVP
eukprot:CAMPEP_0177727658 /NCGR_PEP_ID=MMETSP0484_2-20121128/20443_1 /TAXON_ID=354590 /ORGANISM="Rhodomonas lens, Strain RHODO" /LENGTH=373 /DNA_ID=CAMNT_0019240335 /DNA_START=102 /DNA_END=1219 /DNA_ORIENTATION=+